MANRPLVVAASLVAVSGAAAIGLGPRFEPQVPAVSPQTLAQELDGKLREAATGLHERTSTLATLPSLQATVSTDAATARDQVPKEHMIAPRPGETITIGQVSKAGETNVLLVLPDGDDPALELDKRGLRLTATKDALVLTDVASVMPSDAERAAELSGALAVHRPIDLGSFVQHLDALGATVRVTVAGQTLKLGGRTPLVSDLPAPLSLESPFAKDAKIVAMVPVTSSGPPLRPIGGGLVGLGVILLGLGLRGGRPRPSQPDDLGHAPTPAQTNAGLATTIGSGLNASTIGVGAVLDNTYEIASLLGKGGMGTVWLARHLRLPDKRVAIKVLSTEATNPELLARFRREAEVTSKLGHPNIVGVLDFNELPSGTPYIVLEYLEGQSLADRIEQGPILLDEALEYAKQIASALHAAHKAGIVHRDLKPDNVFLVPTENGQPLVKVLDFGISKMRGGVTVQTQDATVLGTPQYMSPEQANGKNSEVDSRADIWALGTIVYEMVTGQPTFTGDSMTVLLVNVLVNPAPSLKTRLDVPDYVADAIDRALQKEPDARWPDMPSFIAALTGSPLPTVIRTVVTPTLT